MQKVHLQVVTKLFILYIIWFEKKKFTKKKKLGTQPNPLPPHSGIMFLWVRLVNYYHVIALICLLRTFLLSLRCFILPKCVYCVIQFSSKLYICNVLGIKLSTLSVLFIWYEGVSVFDESQPKELSFINTVFYY